VICDELVIDFLWILIYMDLLINCKKFILYDLFWRQPKIDKLFKILNYLSLLVTRGGPVGYITDELVSHVVVTWMSCPPAYKFIGDVKPTNLSK
jgi:hypothetical protein